MQHESAVTAPPLCRLEPGTIIKFIANYIKGRKAYTTYRNHTSKQCQPYIQKVFAWTKQNNLILHPDKTTCTLFTPDPAEYTSNLDLKIQNNALLMATHPKVLGLTLDPKLTHPQHLSTSTQATTNHKALIATGWGKQKETLMATYKAVIRPALEYASCILDQH